MPTHRLPILALAGVLVGCGGSGVLTGEAGTTGTGATGGAGTAGATGVGGVIGGTGTGGVDGFGARSGAAGVTGGGGSRPACTSAPGTDLVPTAPPPEYGFRAARILHAPGRIAVGDVNGDGKADVVTLNAGAEGLLALNDGTGQLGTPTAFGPKLDDSEEILAVTMADLNGDHLGDLIYTHYARDGVFGSKLAVRLRSTTNAFGPAVEYGDAAYVGPIALADVDGDGDQDLVASGGTAAGDFDFFVRRNAGDGTFGTATHFPLGTDGDLLALGDLDGDGKPDLVTAGFSTGTVDILRNLGDGTFSAPVSRPAGVNVGSLVLVDADADGKLDVAVTSYDDVPPYEWSQGSVTVLRNLGDGNLATSVSLPVGGEPIGLAVADLNADGRPDLAVTNFDTRDLSLLFGQGGAGFASELRLPAGTAPFQIVAADLSGDGKADIVVGNDNGDVSVVLSGNPLVVSETPSPFRPGLALVGDVPNAVAVGDLNGDGKPDLAWTDGRNDRLGVQLNTGSGTFADPIELRDDEYAAWPRSIAIGDVSGDGRPDLVSGEAAAGLQIFLGRADGTLAPKMLAVPYLALTSIALADLNGDGKNDIVLGKDGEVRIVFGAGNGSFPGGTSYPRPQGDVSLALGDVTGDGKPDLVVATAGETRTVEVLINGGDGTFTSGSVLTTGAAPAAVAIADLDGDGKRDLAVASDADVWCPAALGGVSVFLNGGGHFAAPLHLARGNYGGIVAADLDGDGQPEIAASDETGAVAIFTIGRAAQPARYTAPASPSALAAADLNGDGRIDLAVTSRFGTLATLLNGAR